jgi:hypothetical protein
MATASSRTLFHYTPNKITSFHNSPKDQQLLLARYGKPMGFWYAYGTNWRNLVEAGRAGRSVNTVTLRYEVSLPEEVFVTDVASATPNTILELSAQNLDEFMERFHRNEYQSSSEDIISAAFYGFVMEGSSAILKELSAKDKTGELRAFLKEIQEEMETQNGYEDPPDYTEIAFDRFSDLFANSRPSSAALRADNTRDYEWGSFWEDVASSVGGIEFHTDLFTIQEWNGIWLPWTDKLSVHSGVIFHPNTFRNGVLVEHILQVEPVRARAGGRRRTRKGRGRKGLTQRRRKTRHGGRRM